MENFKRLVKINREGDTVGFLRVKGDCNGATLNISLIEKLPPCKFIIFDGKNYYFVHDGIILSGTNLINGFCMAAVSNGEITAEARYGYAEFSKEGFIGFEKNYEKKEAYDKLAENEVFYDDFKVAEENYYEKERAINERQPVNYDDLEKEDCKKRQGEGYKAQIESDEADACNGEKSVYKPENGGFFTVESDTILQKGKFKKGRRFDFGRLIKDNPRAYCLDAVIPNTEFYKMGNKKFYFIGIWESENLLYYVYAVPSERGKAPKGFEKAYFIPQDYFIKDKGYYCLFQKCEELSPL